MSTTTQPTPSLTPRTAAVQKQRVPDHEFIDRRVAAAQAARDVRPAKSGMHPVGPIVKTVEAFRWKLLGHIDIVGHGPCLCTQDRKTQRRAALMIDPELSKPHWQEVTPERPVAPEAAVEVEAPPPPAPYRNAELAASIARYHQMLQWDAEDRCFDGDYDWGQQAAALRSELLVEWGVDPQAYTADLPGFDAALLAAEETAAEAGAPYKEPSWAAFVRPTDTQKAA